MDNKVLMISYFYSPYQSPGAIRASKFAKYLPQYGWTPLILTADKNDYATGLPLEVPAESLYRAKQLDVNALPKRFLGRDNVARRGFPIARKTMKSRFAAAGRSLYLNLFNFPDAQIGWYPYARRRALQVIREQKPQVIFTSSSPVTSHLIGYRLKQETGLPWAAELRDLWTQNHNHQRVRPLRFLEVGLERHVLNAADAVITVSEPLAEELRKHICAPIHVICNGFDPSDYISGVPLARPFTISYTGMLYERNQDPAPLFDAIASLHRKKLISPARIRLRFVGRYVNAVREAAEQRKVLEYLDIQDTIEREEALRLQTQSTLLLVLLWNGPQRFGWLSLKLFEYFGAGRPILAVGPKDCGAAMLTAQLNAGFVAESSKELEDILLKTITEFENSGNVSFSPDTQGLSHFERRNLTGELASILNHVTGMRPKALEYDLPPRSA